MITRRLYIKLVLFAAFLMYTVISFSQVGSPGKLTLNDSNYFETRGLNVFVFNSRYGLFGDEAGHALMISSFGEEPVLMKIRIGGMRPQFVTI